MPALRSGVKIKVIEALARGLPVVATPAGVQGIEADESTGCLVGATPEDLAASMRLAMDPETNTRLSKAARKADRRFWVARRSDQVHSRASEAARARLRDGPEVVP